MTPECWQQVIELFNAALDREPGNRAAFLDEACGEDLLLREEVRTLVAAYEQAGNFIEDPALNLLTVVLAQNEARPNEARPNEGNLIAGQTVGPYTVIALLGQGGMGQVYLADDPRLGRKIALKVISSELSKNPATVARFEREARSASSLNHPNILTVYDVGQIGSSHFIATEFVEGETLRQIISKRKIDLVEVLDIAIQIGGALAAAHKNRIAHRDIKPENIMVRPDGLVKVLDFGLAKLTEENTAPTKDQTEAGMIMGSPKYMSPEQARGLPVDTRTDVFSFGAVLYEMITGKAAFNGATISDVLAAVLEKEPLPISAFVLDAPPEIQEILDNALRKDKTLRYQTVNDSVLRLKELKRGLERREGERASAVERREAPRAKINNLPVALTPLVGRESEVAAIKNILNRNEVRLLSLVGTGGTGKTRLALQVAADLTERFHNGIYFVSLASITDPGLVASTIAQTMGLKDTGARPLIEILKEHLQGQQILLLLDNFEQVISAAPMMTQLLAACPDLKILVTSRSPLHVQAEHEFAVQPLNVPDKQRLPSAEAILKYPAVELFFRRAIAVKPDFAMDEETVRAVAEICIRLDGLPLAIELAVARIKILPVQAILARLENRLKLLVSGSQDLPARQQTMRSTIAWSYDLLGEQEKILFSRLAVFVGGLTLEAADEVCNAGGRLEIDILEGLSSLVDKSLLGQSETTGEPRFAMLETIREFAFSCLAADGELDRMRQAHARFFLSLIETAEVELIGARQVAWLSMLEAEIDNLRAAMRWSQDSKNIEVGLRIAALPLRFWEVRGYLSEARAWLKSLLSASRQQDVSDKAIARALSGAGALAQNQGDYEEAVRLLEQGLALHHRLQDKEGIAFSLNILGLLANDRNDPGKAASLLEESLSIYHEIGDKRGVAFSLNHLGVVALIQGDYKRAVELQEENVAIRREIGDKLGIASSLNNLGVIALDDRDYERAKALLAESLDLFRELEDKLGIAASLSNLGELAQYEGKYDEAAAMFEESVAIFRRVGDKRDTTTSLNNLADVARCQGEYDRATRLYLESLALGQEISEKSSIAYSLEGQAHIASLQGQAERAALLLGMAESFRQAAGVTLPPVRRANYDNCVAETCARLGEERFLSLMAQGRGATVKDAIEYARNVV